jgi:hypothetical protein
VEGLERIFGLNRGKSRQVSIGYFGLGGLECFAAEKAEKWKE